MASLADMLKGGMDDRGYGSSSSSGGDDESPDYDASGVAAMKTFIGAVHARDPAGAWDALKQAYEFCEKAGDMAPASGPGPEPEGKHGTAVVLAIPHGK